MKPRRSRGKLAQLEAAAAAAGLRVTRQLSTATLPAVRCSPAERETVEQLAAARGLKLAEHIRTRAIAPLTPSELAAAKKVPE
jgi:hypothetical protein